MPNVWFQKIFIYPPCGRSLEIPRGRGISQPKIFKGKYEAKLEFLEGWCFKVKNFIEEYGYFLELHNGRRFNNPGMPFTDKIYFGFTSFSYV